MFEKLFATRRTNEEIVEETIGEMEQLANDCLKASGVSLFDMFDGLDEESGALLGRCAQSYKKVLKLAREQAQVIDRMETKIDALEEQNVKMFKQLDSLMDLVKSKKEK